MKGKVMAKAAKPARLSRFEQISDEEVTRKWKEAAPRFKRWVILFGCAVPGLYLLNLVLPLQGPPKAIATVAFQISAIFLVCFAVLLMMARKYGRESNKG